MKNLSSLSHRTKEPENSTLYIVGTPIGNMNDFSPRAINILNNVSFIACEDTRQTKKIMTKFDIHNSLISFNKHNSLHKAPLIIENLEKGKSVALVSDAGMPGICDPGEDMIKSAKLKGFDVICIPGACAAITALVSSGMPSSSFVFVGFLPRKKSERKKILLEISESEKTNIIYESPKRLKRLLQELYELCGGDREIEVSRELTKRFEEHIGHNINEVINFFKDKDVMGEITIVLKGNENKRTLDCDELLLKKELSDLIDAGLTVSVASKYLAKRYGIKKSVIYNLR